MAWFDSPEAKALLEELREGLVRMKEGSKAAP
jgi:hypothetical protein